MSQPKNPPRQQINLEFVDDKTAEGIYSNLAMISHSPSEFIIDFARLLPNTPKTKIFARVVMTPHHVKLLRNALDQNIEKFEKQFGKISDIQSPQPDIDKKIGF